MKLLPLSRWSPLLYATKQHPHEFDIRVTVCLAIQSWESLSLLRTKMDHLSLYPCCFTCEVKRWNLKKCSQQIRYELSANAQVSGFQRQTHKVMTQTLYRVTIKKLLMFKGVSLSHFAPVLSIILSRSNTGWMGNLPSVSHMNSV